MNKIVIVGDSHSHPETRCWLCPTENEAISLAKWLMDNGIVAATLNSAEYNEPVVNWDKDRE